MVNKSENNCYFHMQQAWSAISIHLKLCFWPPRKYKMDIYSHSLYSSMLASANFLTV